nr:MAG TPA: hypothetical protein [Caudoviricetes sp.]
MVYPSYNNFIAFFFECNFMLLKTKLIHTV